MYFYLLFSMCYKVAFPSLYEIPIDEMFTTCQTVEANQGNTSLEGFQGHPVCNYLQ